MLTRKKIIKIALESGEAKGTKVAGTLALATFDLIINPAAPFEERRGSGLYMGHKERGVIGEEIGTCTFRTELKGNGSGGADAAIAALLQACAFKKTAEVYNLHSSLADQKTISIDVWEDGVKKGLAGAMGNITFEGDTGKAMFLNVELSGIWQTPVDEVMPAFVPGTALPLMLKKGTFTIATAEHGVSSLAINPQADVQPAMDINADSGVSHYYIGDYDPQITADPEATLVATEDWFGKWIAGTEAAIALELIRGSDKAAFAMPKVQYRELGESDRNNLQVLDLTGQLNHDSGDDCLTITFSAVGG